jgi:hypothetical protein
MPLIIGLDIWVIHKCNRSSPVDEADFKSLTAVKYGMEFTGEKTASRL